MRAREQRKFAKKVDDDEETMSVEDAVPCDQRTIGVVDSGGTGKKQARKDSNESGRAAENDYPVHWPSSPSQ